MSSRRAHTSLPRPTVGVVIPAHNAAAFIEQALAGVAGQTCAPSRVVVVDDASSDGTADIAESWCDRMPLTVVRLTDNVGSGEARRKAIELLDTELLAPLDADDVWLPDHLEHLVGVWSQHPGSVVSARAEVWRPGERRVDYHRALGLRVPRHNQLSALLSGNFVFFGSVFSREEYERVGGFGRHRGWEDWELWVKMAANHVPILLADFPTVLYRRHDKNLTQDSAGFDQALVDRIVEFRRQHPEWLEAAQWDRVVRHRRAMGHFNQATARLRRRQPAGAVELARAILLGGAPMVRHIARQFAYRLWANRPGSRRAVRFR